MGNGMIMEDCKNKEAIYAYFVTLSKILDSVTKTLNSSHNTIS